jgi:peptide/nickel transport system substrate-binding protein
MSKILRQCAFAGLLGLAANGATAQTIELAVDQSPAGLDPHIITAFSSFAVVNGTIYEGLTQLGLDLRVEPGLASSWTISPDGKNYTFKLRDNVTFHNGQKMDANDAAASLRRILSKDVASPLASRLAAVEEVRALDAATLEVKLKEPSAPLLATLTTMAIVPRNFEADKDSLQKQPVGTGPFRFQEWQPNSFIQLSRHDAYWRQGSPKATAVKFNIVPESATRQVGLVNGQFALLPNIDAATALQLQGKANVKIEQTMELAYTLIGMNVSKPPFNNEKVREALNYALNRQEIIDGALFGKGVPAGPLSPVLKEWAVDTKEFACYSHNLDRAKALLREAGVSLPVAVTMNVLPRQDIKDIAQVVQQQLDKAGFKVEIKNQELGQFVQDWRNSNFDLFASTNAGSVDPDDYFYRAFRTGGSTNVFKYSNADVDGLLDQGRSVVDMSKRQAIYNDVQKRLACTGPIAHLAYPMLFSAMRTNLSGYHLMANRSLMTLGSASAAR